MMKSIVAVITLLISLTAYSKDPKRLRTALDDDASADKMRSAMLRQLAMSPDDLSDNSAPQEVSIALPIQFEFGSAELTTQGAEILSKAAEAMNSTELVSLNFVIEGHTDSVGSNEFNLILSEKRAQSAKNHLIKNGINSKRLTAFGFGELKPIEASSSIDPSQRRVEIVTTRNGND